MAKIQRQTPRQKMINLMYIVLTAMLALNVSSDVLDGFSEVERSVLRTTKNATSRNATLLDNMTDIMSRNEEKSSIWYHKAVSVKQKADSLNAYIEDLKHDIVIEADGDNGNPDDIKSRENLDAATNVMLSPLTNNGRNLRNALEQFKSFLEQMNHDSLKRELISDILTTENRRNSDGVIIPWEEQKFANKPVIAAITLLSQLQSDVRYAEGETLVELINNIDAGDVRVNEMNALVLPKSNIVMRGSNYEADIILAAVDSTQRPSITINGNKLNKGQNTYTVSATGLGEINYDGMITVNHPDGSISEHPFNGSYTVIEPMATVSATMMNILYCGIDNPVSISVPGVPQSKLTATMTNGTLIHHGNEWIAKPDKIGTDSEITVTAEIDGVRQRMTVQKFKVRKLPDPKPFIAYNDANGNRQEYRGSAPLSKTSLISASGIDAAIDDGLINITFKIISFETIFFDSLGNAIPEISDGAKFSQRQKDAFRRLSRGKRFYISKVKAIGPDGIERNLAPLEVIIQ